MSLEALCFTATMGRGHYSCRLALVVHSMHELKEKLNRVIAEGLPCGQEQDGMFCHAFKVVPESKRDKAAGEITESGLQHLLEKAQELLERVSVDDYYGIAEVCKLYVQG
ncbi:hypothetical protein ACEQ6C_38605, partial [Rhizobium ruizarguesonis]